MVKIHFLQKVLKKWSSFRKKIFFFFHNRGGGGGSGPYMEFSIIDFIFFLNPSLSNNSSSLRKQRVESNSNLINSNQSDINMKEIFENMISQDGEKWICNNCGKEARTKGSIELHAEIHIESLRFNCSKCDKTFRSRNLLSHHRKRCQ